MAFSAWIVDRAGDELWEIPDPATPGTGTNHGNLPTGLTGPGGIAFDAAGHAWVVADSGDELWEIPDPATPGTGTNHGNLPTGLTGPGGIAFDAAGHAWVVADSGDELWEIPDPATPGTGTNHGNLPTGLTGPGGIAFDAAGHAWVVDLDGDELFEIPDPATPGTGTNHGNLPTGLTGPGGIAFDAAGHAWIVDFAGDELFEIPDPATPGTGTNHGNLPTGLTSPGGVFAMRTTKEHAVDAGSAAHAWAVPQADVTHTAIVLALADFDATGLDVDVLMLVDAASATTLYADSTRSGRQSIGDLDASSDGVISAISGTISRVRIQLSGRGVLINTRGNTSDQSAHFGASNTISEWSLYVQTADGVVSTSQLNFMGGGFSNWEFADADATFLDAITSGERAIIAFARQFGALAVDADPAAFEFAAPEADVTHTPAAAHAVNGSPTLHAWTAPQAAVTHTPALGHAVNADPAAHAWAVPQASVDLDRRHEVTPAAAAHAWAVPEAAVTRTSGFGVNSFATTGLVVEVLALIEAGSHDEPYRVGVNPSDPPRAGALGTGSDLAFDRADIEINRVRFSGDDVILNRAGADSFSDVFQDPSDTAPHTYDDTTVYIQTEFGTGRVEIPCLARQNDATGGITDAGGGFLRLRIPSADLAETDAVGTGDRFLLAFARQSTVNMVDAAPASWAFTSPEASVLHSLPGQHAINGTPALHAWALPEAGVTHTARVPDDHAVDGGPAAHAWAIPQATVTRTGSTTVDHAVAAGTAVWSFAVPAAGIARTVSHTINATAAAWGIAVPEPAVTRTIAPAAPSFASSAGDQISASVGSAIDDVTVPEADGNPAPTYAIVGSLPAGVAFDTSSRTLRFTASLIAAGSGTIRVRATNSEGTADWTVTYTFAAVTAEVPSPPLFPRIERATDGTGLDLVWEPPLDDGGGEITAYEAMVCDEANQNCGWEKVWPN